MPRPGDDIPVRLRGDERSPAATSIMPLSAQALLRGRRLVLASRSAAALAAGVGFLWPSLSEAALVWLFAGYAFLDGALTVSGGGWSPAYRRVWPLLTGGFISMLGGGTAYVWPHMSPLLLGNIASVWALGIGLMFLAASFSLRCGDPQHLWFGCAIAALLFARALLSHVASDVIILSTWLALYALAMSVLFLKLALQHYDLWLE
ncbi:MAG: hypothetical protein JO001_18265 [Alphaproteobacteria bacterium]|nr:hypothetical protein [Alphaproteobacteria bacterium]